MRVHSLCKRTHPWEVRVIRSDIARRDRGHNGESLRAKAFRQLDTTKNEGGREWAPPYACAEVDSYINLSKHES